MTRRGIFYSLNAMAKKTFSVDDTLFKAQTKKLVRKLKLDEPKFVREQAGMLAQLLTKLTPPFPSFPEMKGAGYGDNIKENQAAGIKAVKSGFLSAVKFIGNMDSFKSKDLRSAVERGDTAYLTARVKHFKGKRKGLRVVHYSDHMRNKMRNGRGRVNKGTVPIIGLSQADVEAGLARAIYNVGISKAAIAKAAFRLGRKKPTKWVYKHFSRVQVSVQVRKNPAVATFKVAGPGLEVPIRRLKQAESFRQKAMALKLKSDLNRRIKQVGF